MEKFNIYFKRYLDSRGIKYSSVAREMNLNYRTFQSKLKNDSFTYVEIIALNFTYSDLLYLDNFKRYLELV